MSRIPASLAPLILGLALLAPATVVAATKEVAPVTKNGRAVSPAAKPASDAGAKDPADFPRPPGLVRRSYNEDPGKVYRTEIATYHAQAGMDEVAAHYLKELPAAGWRKVSDSVSGSDVNRLRMIEWHSPTKEAEVRFYAAKGGGSDLRVRIFTYKTTAKAAADAGPATASTTQAAAVGATAKSNATGAAPLGPPPTNFKIQSDNAYSHNVTWSATDATGFDLYRLDSNGRTQVADHITEKKFTDLAFLEPNTIYRLVVHYANGSDGSLDYTYANPPQPGVVSNLKAVQTGPGKVKLTWDREHPLVNNPGVAETYQVSCPTYAAAGRRIDINSLELTGLPVGNHWVRVAVVYGDSPKMAPAPKEVSVNFDVLTDRNKYRVTILGLECTHETEDDALQLDGKHDEVYLGVYLASVPRQSGSVKPTPLGILQTKVMGDINGFPNRVQAGTASPKGGIQTNDFVPDATITTPKPGVTGTTDRFPLRVWEGELIDTSDYVVISPILFEWDSTDTTAWNKWMGWWSPTAPGTNTGFIQLGTSVSKAKPEYLGITLALTWETEALSADGDRWTKYFGLDYNEKTNRPLAVMNQAVVWGSVSTVPDYTWVPAGLRLTRSIIEKQLGTQNSVVIPWKCADENYEIVNPDAVLAAYKLYIQIERLPDPAAPAAATPPAPVAPTPPKTDLPTANPAMVSKAKQAQMTKNFGAVPVGPPPANLRVDSNGPVAHKVSWTADQWTVFDVYRIDSKGRTPVATSLTTNSVTEHVYLEPNTIYRVDVHHTDGSIGSAEYNYAKPPQPETPTEFRAAQAGEGKVKLSWATIPYNSSYQLYGPTLPPGGEPVSSGYTRMNSIVYTTEITGVPLGTHEFSLATVYSGEGKLYPAPAQARASVTVHRVADNYRVTLLGLRCGNETIDDMLQLDGKHDEIFGGAYVASVPRENVNSPRPTPISIIRTKVMGDINGFPDRLQAGSASPKGGIQTGDYVPDASVASAKPGVTGTTDRFPLALWEGELSDTGDIIVVAPVVFEWDKPDEAPWNGWTGWWSSPRGSADLGNLAHTIPSDGRWEIVLSTQWSRPINAYDKYYVNYGPGFSESGGNRPVGVEDQANIRSDGNVVPTPVYVPRGLCLTHAKVEKALGTQSTTVIEWVARDDPHVGHAKLDGTYTLYIQIERLAPPK